MADVVKVHNRNRGASFRRWLGDEEFLVVASFNNYTWEGYSIEHRNLKGKKWREVFSSDATVYGGGGLHNEGVVDSSQGTLSLRIPANSITAFARIT